jgi:hypothetical protein
MAENEKLSACKNLMESTEGKDRYKGEKDGLISNDATNACHRDALQLAKNELAKRDVEVGVPSMSNLIKAARNEAPNDPKIAQISHYLEKYGLK